MPADTLRGRIPGMWLFVVLLVAAAPSAVARQADTIDVAASPGSRALLSRAEALLANGQAGDAYRILSTAEPELAGDPYFDYLLGVASLDAGRTSESIFALRRSIAVAPRFAGARMELARAYYESGNVQLARPLFVALLDENPPPHVRDVIGRYIDAIDARPELPAARFDPWVETFVGYDSNANGSTASQQFLGFTLSPENLETESPFVELGAGFNWAAPTSTRFAWLANARLGHRHNTDASFVDATIVSGYGGGSWQRGAYFGRAGLDGYWSSRDGDANEAYGGVDLLFGRRFGAEWDLTLGLRGGANRFDGSLEVLDVDRFLYTLGIARRLSATSRLSLEAIGGSDREKQSGSPYGNSKAGARLAFGTAVGGNAFLQASIGSLKTDYDGLFFGLVREDTQLSAALRIEFRDVKIDGLTIVPTVRYIDNDSDVALYEYDRTEIGLFIRWMPR